MIQTRENDQNLKFGPKMPKFGPIFFLKIGLHNFFYLLKASLMQKI